MPRATKTHPWIVWPDGRALRVRREGRMWVFGNAGSSHLDAVREYAERHGGRLERRPNPSYESERKREQAEKLARLFGSVFTSPRRH